MAGEPCPTSDTKPEPTKVDDPLLGMSFMGGDPCSSPYNDDPFDELDAKPDAMAELKRRVKALEEARKQTDEKAS